MNDICKELVQFLRLSTRIEIKLTATKNVLSLTGSSEGRKFILDNNNLLEAIFTLTKDTNILAAEDCYLSLVNLTTENSAVEVLKKYNILSEFFNVIRDSSSSYADHACMIVNNLSRSKNGSEWCLKTLCESDFKLLKTLLEVYCNVGYNTAKCSLDYLGSLFANLTQLHEGREFFLTESVANIQKIISFLQYEKSVIRRGAAALVLRNCGFSYDKHKWLLSDEVDLLSHILLPLAGPEEFKDDEVDKLPVDLQYLPNDKTREPDQDIRKVLVETILLLCATKDGREFIKSRNTYLIIRELFNWESENQVQEVIEECNKLIQILVVDPEVDNLLTYEIPEKHKKILEQNT